MNGLIHLSSNDPYNYGTIKFTSSLTQTKSVMYRLNSLTTTASFSITTQDDWLEITKISDNSIHKYYFPDRAEYDMDSLPATLNKILSVGDFPLTVTTGEDGLLILSASDDFIISDCTHRVKLILGLYHAKKFNSSECKFKCPSFPYLCYGNILYLTARTDAISIINARGNEESQSIIYKTNEVLYNGFPVNCKQPGTWFKIKINELQKMEFILVDFMLEPVVLHAPLFITLEYCESPIVYEHI